MTLIKMPQTDEARSLHWCFTWNNPPAQYQNAATWSTHLQRYADKIQYLVAQLEIGESGTPHWQGYIEFLTRTKLATLKRMIPSAHWEKRRGTRIQARAYCQKDETRVGNEQIEMGRWIEEEQDRRGNQIKYREMINMIKEGKKDLEIADAFPALYLRHHSAIDKLRLACTKARDWVMEVIVLIGPTGTGKTHTAVHENGGIDKCYIKEAGPWWDAYDGQEVVVLDEFAGWIPFTELLRLCDRYPHKVPVKGGFRQFTSRKIFITSNHAISSWYHSERVQPYYPALYRRITEYRLCLAIDNHCRFTDRGTYELMAQQHSFLN